MQNNDSGKYIREINVGLKSKVKLKYEYKYLKIVVQYLSKCTSLLSCTALLSDVTTFSSQLHSKV